MTVFELLAGIHPYGGRQFDMLCLLKFTLKKTPSLDQFTSNLPEQLKEIVEKGWSFDAKDRPEFKEIADITEELCESYSAGEKNKALEEMRKKLEPPLDLPASRIIDLESSPTTDNSWIITLKLTLDVSFQEVKDTRVPEIRSLMSRCHQRDWWVDSGRGMGSELASRLLSTSKIKLHQVHLPEPGGNEICLVMHVETKRKLKKLRKRFKRNGALASLLMPSFKDGQLREACKPAQPKLVFKGWKDQYKAGLAHYKKNNPENKPSKKNKDPPPTTASGNTASGVNTITTDSTENVTMASLQDIAELVPGDALGALGRHLQLSDIAVSNIRYTCRGERVDEMAYQVMKEWMQQNGSRSSKKLLAEALWKAKCYEAARSVK